MEAYTGAGRPAGAVRRFATETKQAFKTTEFWIYLVFVVGVLIAGTVDDAEGSEFGADRVWLYIAIATAAYLISRGLAKSGSQDPYRASDESHGADGVGERVKAAAQVLAEGQQARGTTEQPTTADRR